MRYTAEARARARMMRAYERGIILGGNPIDGQPWDMMIAHPPYTFLAVSGARWWAQRQQQQAAALAFVRELLDAPIPRIALENPIGIIGKRVRAADQIIQPWQFGHDASKATCLWLKNLPLLKGTKNVDPMYSCPKCRIRFEYALGKYGCPGCAASYGQVARPVWGNQTESGQNRLPPSPDRWKLRSVTYSGIAAAMAAQWGEA